MNLLSQIALKLIVALIPDWVRLSFRRKLIKAYLAVMLLIFLIGGLGFLGMIVTALFGERSAGGISVLFGFLAFVCLFFAAKILMRLRRPV